MGVVGVGQITLFDQNDTPIASLSNYAHPVPSNSDGSSPNLTGAVSTFQILLAGIDITNLYTVTATPLSGITGTLATYTYTVATMTVDAGYVDFSATRPGFATLTKRFSLSKTKQGITGPQGVDSPACLGLFNYADRGTITGMVAGSLAVLYSATVGERGIYAYISSTWTRQTAPTPDQITRTWLYVLDAVQQGYGVSSHYIGSSTSFEILMVKFMYLLKARLEDSGAIYSGGYDENGGNDGTPGAYISGAGAFAGVGASFLDMVSNSITADSIKTLVKYVGSWVYSNTFGSSATIRSSASQQSDLLTLPNGEVLLIFAEMSGYNVYEKKRATSGTWGQEVQITSFYTDSRACLLPDGSVLLLYRKPAGDKYGLFQKIRTPSGVWGNEAKVIDDGYEYGGFEIRSLSDGTLLLFYRNNTTGYLTLRIRNTSNVWGSASAVGSRSMYIGSVIILTDNSAVIVYHDSSTRYTYSVTRTYDGTFSGEVSVSASAQYPGGGVLLPDGTCIYYSNNTSNRYLYNSIRNTSGTWSSIVLSVSQVSLSPKPCVLTNGGNILLVDTDNSTYYLRTTLNNSAYSALPIGNFPTDVGSGVVEVGQNSNGTYVKLGDGTMICYGTANITSAYPTPFSFPAQFSNTGYNAFGTFTLSGQAGRTVNEDPSAKSTTGTAMWVFGSSSQTPSTSGTLVYIVIGRWK